MRLWAWDLQEVIADDTEGKNQVLTLEREAQKTTFRKFQFKGGSFLILKQ